MSEVKELVPVPAKETALSVFIAKEGLEPWLQQIRVKVDEFNATLPELTTVKGRKAYASMAYQLAQTKNALEDVGKKLSAEQKEVPKLIDAERKRVWDKLELWQKEVRKPLDDWQAAEDRRIDAIKADIERISDQAMNLDGITAEDLQERISKVEAIAIADKWAEFQVDAALAKEKTLVALRSALTARQQYEADQAELAQRRADDEARAQREHDEQIRKEAAEQAQKDADEAARLERNATAIREQNLIDQAAQARRDTEQAERAAAQAKTDQLAAEQLAEQEKKDSAARAEKAAEDARQAEIKRQKDAADEIIRQQNLREADNAHKGRVMRAAKEALIGMNISEELAKAIVLKIARGEVPNITINF